jgi:uncharacterized membrane protein YccC
VTRRAIRITGSAVGATIAVIVIGLFVYDPLPFCLCLFALACAGLIGFATSRHGSAWLVGTITGNLVMLMALDHSGAVAALFRHTEARILTT